MQKQGPAVLFALDFHLHIFLSPSQQAVTFSSTDPAPPRLRFTAVIRPHHCPRCQVLVDSSASTFAFYWAGGGKAHRYEQAALRNKAGRRLYHHGANGQTLVHTFLRQPHRPELPWRACASTLRMLGALPSAPRPAKRAAVSVPITVLISQRFLYFLYTPSTAPPLLSLPPGVTLSPCGPAGGAAWTSSSATRSRWPPA